MIDWPARRLETRDATSLVVIHHTAGSPHATVEAIDRFHREVRGWRGGFGYHYLIGPGGAVHLGRPVDTVGSHAVGWNHVSVGIALAGDYREHDPDDAMVDAALGLVVDLRSRYGALRVLTHRQAMAEIGRPGHTDCGTGRLHHVVESIRERLPADGPA